MVLIYELPFYQHIYRHQAECSKEEIQQLKRNMLFIQGFSVYYDKDSRSGEEMRQINAMRFMEAPETELAGEIYFHHGGRKAKTFKYRDKERIAYRVYIRKQGEAYQVFYSNHPEDNFFKPVLTLEKNQYGRIVYNMRESTFDGEWFYIRTTLNFIHADSTAFRRKIFFRKEPDFLLEDLSYLRYCGEYRKRRMTHAGKNHHH